MGEPEGGLVPPPPRLIASIAKQPRGLTRTGIDVPLGCFGALRLAMTREGAAGHFPPACKGLGPRLRGERGVETKNKALTPPSPTGRGLRKNKPSPPGGRGLGEGVFRPPTLPNHNLIEADLAWAGRPSASARATVAPASLAKASASHWIKDVRLRKS